MEEPPFGIVNTVCVAGNHYQLDYYDRVIGAAIRVQLPHSTGIIECRLQPRLVSGRILLEADMWRREVVKGKVENSYVTFSASCYLERDGDRYVICQPTRYRNCNPFWVELERLISNEIVTNE